MKRITLETTNVCNLSCKPCPRHHIKMPSGYINQRLWNGIIDSLVAGTVIIPFWRGEATLHPKIEEMLWHAVCRGMRIVLATNGYFIKEALSVDLIQMFEAISVSLHDDKSVEGYQYLLEKITNHHVKLQATVVEGEYEPPKDLCVRPYSQHTLNGVWGRTDEKHGTDQYWCRRLSTDLVITWDGKVSRCCYVWEPIKGLNANRQTIKEIWRSPQLKQIRENYPDEVCGKCDQWQGEGRSI